MTNDMSATEPSRPRSEEIDKRHHELQLILLGEAVRAARDGDLDRHDELMARLSGDGGRPATKNLESLRERRLDTSRIVMAAALVAGLIAIVTYAIRTNSDTANQYVPLVSGLAGIAIGWLYGSTGQRQKSSD